MSREEDINEWIISSATADARQERIVPSTTEKITHRPLGSALDAMSKIALFLGDHPELPIVEMGQIRPERINITFAEPVDLPRPFFAFVESDPTQWAIDTIQALLLETGEVYGWQSSALTSLGNSESGSKLLLNTERWQVLGSAGMQSFTQALMVGQVMEQATEPWAARQHIWLVGFGELGEKLQRFLTSYHALTHLHLVERIEEIPAHRIRNQHATVYVLDSNAQTLDEFNALEARHAGLMADTVITERSMWISENDDEGSATIVNVGPNGVKLWPNLVFEDSPLHQAMDLVWETGQKEVRAASAEAQNLRPEDFLDTAPAKSPTPASPTAEDHHERMLTDEELQALLDGTDSQPQTPISDAPSQAPSEPVQVASIPDAAPEPASEPSEGENADEDTNKISETSRENTTSEPNDVDSESGENLVHEIVENEDEDMAGVNLFLCGATQIVGSSGSRAGAKYAEAAALLHLNGPMSSTAVTEALWPESETEGQNARVRRSRTAKKIKEILPEHFTNDTVSSSEGQWRVEGIITDVDRILSVLQDPKSSEEAQTAACQRIGAPLATCGSWAEPMRSAIVQQLKDTLTSLTDQALERDHFKTAKAARAAYKSL